MKWRLGQTTGSHAAIMLDILGSWSLHLMRRLWSTSMQEVAASQLASWYWHTAGHLISVTIFSFTHPPILSTLLLVLSTSRLSTVSSHTFSVFSPSTWVTFHFLSEIIPSTPPPLLDSFRANLKTFPKQLTCHAFPTSTAVFLHH